MSLMREVLDNVVEAFGLTSVPDRPDLFAGGVRLDVPLRCQLDSYSCGAQSGFAVARAFGSRVSYAQFRRSTRLTTDGCAPQHIIKALDRHGVRAATERRLSMARLRDCIDQGCPVIIGVQNPKADAGHWVVVYGYDQDAGTVFMGVNGLPWFNRREYSVREFRKLWAPKGWGLVCSGRRRLRCRMK